MNIQAIPLDLVDVGERLREVDEEFARLIAASMQKDGQRTPVELRRNGPDGRYTLIAGAHRMRAAQIAGLSELQAVVMQVSDLDAERLEIEENLCRRDLTDLDRATFLARWKAVYEALNPAAKHGARGRGRLSGQIEHSISGPLPDRFSAVASERLGLSEQSIRRATKRYKAIPGDVRLRISGTWLADHGGQLDLLAKLRPEAQRRVIDLMIERGATDIRHLRDEMLGLRAPAIDQDQAQFDALVKLWDRAGPKAQRRFRDEILSEKGA